MLERDEAAERLATRPARSLRDTGAGAGVDNAWEQEKLEARKLLENAAESPESSARCVGRIYCYKRVF